MVKTLLIILGFWRELGFVLYEKLSYVLSVLPDCMKAFFMGLRELLKSILKVMYKVLHFRIRVCKDIQFSLNINFNLKNKLRKLYKKLIDRREPNYNYIYLEKYEEIMKKQKWEKKLEEYDKKVQEEIKKWNRIINLLLSIIERVLNYVNSKIYRIRKKKLEKKTEFLERLLRIKKENYQDFRRIVVMDRIETEEIKEWKENRLKKFELKMERKIKEKLEALVPEELKKYWELIPQEIKKYVEIFPSIRLEGKLVKFLKYYYHQKENIYSNLLMLELRNVEEKKIKKLKKQVIKLKVCKIEKKEIKWNWEWKDKLLEKKKKEREKKLKDLEEWYNKMKKKSQEEELETKTLIKGKIRLFRCWTEMSGDYKRFCNKIEELEEKWNKTKVYKILRWFLNKIKTFYRYILIIVKSDPFVYAWHVFFLVTGIYLVLFLAPLVFFFEIIRVKKKKKKKEK
jgi:hypothetical protein